MSEKSLINIIGEEIYFRGNKIAFLNPVASETDKGEFKDNINGLILNNEEMQELKSILCGIQCAQSELDSAESDLDWFLDKIKKRG